MKCAGNGRGRGCRRGVFDASGRERLVRTVLDWGERGAGDGGGGKGAVQGGKLWGKSVLTGRGTRGCGEVCEWVGVQEVAVGGVEDHIVRGGEGLEGLREWT